MERNEILEKEKEKELLLGVPLIHPLLGSALVTNVLVKRFEPTDEDKRRLHKNKQQNNDKFVKWFQKLPKYDTAMLKRQSKIRLKSETRDDGKDSDGKDGKDGKDKKDESKGSESKNKDKNKVDELKPLPMMDEDRTQIFDQAFERLMMPKKSYYVTLQGFRKTHGLLVAKMYNQYFVQTEHQNRLIRKLCANFEQNYHILLKWSYQLVLRKDEV